MNKLELFGNWNIIKGKLKERFGVLTDNDLLYIKGKEEELLGRIQRRLGKTKRELLELIEQI
ncbi:CsbD family protein [Chryseolinea sp. H1M3-3]|uniref:CsbD family protein n=1 Tax=Chryseolinea sp. H1M3-3 TaxID=3034144 RepID=UPI0023EB06A4|nr:CsbD family protein [Chryseolinea sp. H1M3-3]